MRPPARRRWLQPAIAAALFASLLGAKAPVPATGTFSFFVGGLHSHTGYSDGVPGTTPAAAYARARDTENLDFFAITEHSEALDTPFTLSEDCLAGPEAFLGCALADDPADAAMKWDAQRRQAVQESQVGAFAALRGFEWSSDVHGHANVYFSRNYTQWVRDGGNATLAGFYQWLQTPAWMGGGADGLATFNHPADKTLCNATNLDQVAPNVCALDPAANWNDFAYVPELDNRIVGIEVFNRARNYEPLVVKALDKGWHLGLLGAEDIHQSNWGSPSYAKTVFQAQTLSAPALKDALANRRVQATLDPSIRISFTAGGLPMGSRLNLSVPPGPVSPVPLAVHVEGGNVGRVDILTNGGAVFASAAGRDLTVDAPNALPEAWYLVRVVEPGGRKVAYSSPIWIQRNGAPPIPERTNWWVAGDLHVHTTWSHDSFEGPHDDNTGADKGYTLGWTPGEQIAIAESRGLDFVALTDHNDTRSVLDPGFTSGSVTLMPSYENSLGGHVQMLNVPSCVYPEGVAGAVTGCNSFPNRDDPARVKALAQAVRAQGGAFQINHPSDGDWLARFGDGTAVDPIVPDSIEIWNIGPWYWQHPMPSSNDNDFSLRFWETYLNRGYHVAATGGSDNHWRSTTAVQGVGQPTTWVNVRRPGVAGIVEGIRAGRTTVSHLPPAMGGPQLFLQADANGDGIFESMAGDTVPPGAIVRAYAVGAVGAVGALPGAEIHLISRDQTTVGGPSGVTMAAPAGGWVRAELRRPDARAERTATCNGPIGSSSTYCRNRLIVEALTSPVYVSA